MFLVDTSIKKYCTYKKKYVQIINYALNNYEILITKNIKNAKYAITYTKKRNIDISFLLPSEKK